tara:strand:- start:1370 stop:1747 length:378 start_codon:yes stop_codon:yes gene_type:complete
MNDLEITLSLITTVSILLNIGLFLYLRGVLVRLLSISEELGDLQDMTNSFTTHLKNVYELETFYGDQTLANLLSHAVSYNEQLETFEYIYTLTETDEEEKEINFDETDIDFGEAEEEAPEALDRE